MFLRNVGICLRIPTASWLRTTTSSQLWEPLIDTDSRGQTPAPRTDFERVRASYMIQSFYRVVEGRSSVAHFHVVCSVCFQVRSLTFLTYDWAGICALDKSTHWAGFLLYPDDSGVGNVQLNVAPELHVHEGLTLVEVGEGIRRNSRWILLVSNSGLCTRRTLYNVSVEHFLLKYTLFTEVMLWLRIVTGGGLLWTR
jgi:hypothetical protein